MSTVLVTGASGFVGSYVVPALLHDDPAHPQQHRVAALVRSGAAGDRVMGRLQASERGRVELRKGDVGDAASLRAALAGVDQVVHLVALPRDRDGGASLNRVNVDGTRNVVEAMKSAGVSRLVHQGALGVVDDPALHYASSKARAIAIVQSSGLDWTVLRPSLLWGERDGFFNIIAGLVRMSPGIVPVPGDGRSRFQPLAVGDLARIVRLCLDRPETIHRTYDLGGPRVMTYREITAEVLRGMGKRRAIVPMPVPLIGLVARTAELTHLPFPVASDQLRQLRLDNVAALDTVPAEFGFEPIDMAGHLGYLRLGLRQQDPASSSPGVTA